MDVPILYAPIRGEGRFLGNILKQSTLIARCSILHARAQPGPRKHWAIQQPDRKQYHDDNEQNLNDFFGTQETFNDFGSVDQDEFIQSFKLPPHGSSVLR